MYIAVEGSGINHYIDESDTKIFSTKEAAEKYITDATEFMIQDARNWLSKMSEADRLNTMNRYTCSYRTYTLEDTEDYILAEHTHDWVIKKIEFLG